MKKINNTSKIVMFYVIISFIIVTVFYFILPNILNYPPDSLNNQFQKDIDTITYNEQFLGIISCATFISILTLIINLKRIDVLIKKLDDINIDLNETIFKIRRLCLNTPLILYFVQLMIITVIIPSLLIFKGAELLVVIKISLGFILFFALASVMCYIFSQNEFKKILYQIYNKYPMCINEMNFKGKNKVFVTSLKTTLILEILPLIIIALVFTSLTAYTISAKEVGTAYYNSYIEKMLEFKEKREYKDKDDILSELKEMSLFDNEHVKFLIDTNGEYVVCNNIDIELSDFFVKYTLEKSITQKGRTYDYYCIDRQGTTLSINTQNGNTYFVGIMYNTNSIILLLYLLLSFVFLFIIILFTLIYIVRNIVKDIKRVSNNLNEIANKNNLNKKLPILSNDEIADLTNAFNKIQDLTKEHIEKLVNQQDIIDKQGRLTVLGELAGGMAHDINTPVATINTGLLMLEKDLSKEDKEAVISNIKLCTQKINDIVNSVRDQIRNLGSSNKKLFNLNKLVNEILILIQSELLKSGCNINIDINKSIDIYGESNKLRTSN